MGEGIVPAAARSWGGGPKWVGGPRKRRSRGDAGGEGLAVAPGAAEPRNVLGVKAAGMRSRILAGTPRCWPRCSR